MIYLSFIKVEILDKKKIISMSMGSRAHAKLDKELSHLLEEKQQLRSKLSKLQKHQSELFTKATQKH